MYLSEGITVELTGSRNKSLPVHDRQV